jgi:hypothetical protein
MDATSQPQSITLAEWTAWSTAQLAKSITEEMLKQLAEQQAAGDSDEDDEDDDEEEDEDAILDAAVKKFKDEHGRDPTEEEVRADDEGLHVQEAHMY